ncbi:uncharacterized protein LOC115231953 [Octopus sinensis]|uniref:Uncharacterized protein LOC115231953 n=1 Tax=Octopus sinensis TaxID=2607531 RepID=A0A6P7U5T6_9MOLL|nr:uncharacterized protein LOC115231953 [Octopus sinensis]
MSRAFDSIHRDLLMRVLRSFLDEDAIRMIQVLLAKTDLTVRLGTTSSRSFPTNVGTPQGDSLSPLLFVIYLEAALRELRGLYDKSITEVIYADDVDFVSTDKSALLRLLEIAPDKLGEWFLIMNTDKTDVVDVSRSDTQTMEKWRLSKKLGSLLGDREDIMRRKLLAAVALKSVMKDWLRYCPGNPSLRSRIYNAFVKPVLLYNSSTWGISDTELKNLDSFHRKQLRVLNGLHWPKKLTTHRSTNSVTRCQSARTS